MSTAQKIRTLQAANEDYEFYPTTTEIMEAMKDDIWKYLRSHERGYHDRRRQGLDIHSHYDKRKERQNLFIETLLDIGAGDGRVLNFFGADKKYGIEIARAQANDLICKGVFLIGRNFYDTTLIDQYYSLVFSNPPFSDFERWVCKILYECNFCLLYLVMPVRWKDNKIIAKEMERYEATVVDEFDFSEADRAARGKVHLVRVNATWIKGKTRSETYQDDLEDTFERWVREHIGDFKRNPERNYQEERDNALALRLAPIDQLVSNYEAERESLGAAFKTIGKLDNEIILLMGLDKKSMLEIIRKSIESLKSKYWRAAFDKLEPVQKRMIQKTKDRIFSNIEEFKTLDFNADNIYSIIIWIINNSNIGILDQIGEVFDILTTKEFITEYKSNRHWAKSDWRHTQNDWKYEKLPARWKLGLDYRIVVGTYAYDRWDRKNRRTIVDDFIVVCGNLGFPIAEWDKPDYELHQTEQKFHTTDGELAFTMRYYTGNQNVHLKINKRLLMKFNIEVAKIRKWMSDPDDVVEEFDVPKDEAVRLWNSGLALLGNSDVKMLEFK